MHHTLFTFENLMDPFYIFGKTRIIVGFRKATNRVHMKTGGWLYRSRLSNLHLPDRRAEGAGSSGRVVTRSGEG